MKTCWIDHISLQAMLSNYSYFSPQPLSPVLAQNSINCNHLKFYMSTIILVYKTGTHSVLLIHTFGIFKNILIFNKNSAYYALCGKYEVLEIWAEFKLITFNYKGKKHNFTPEHKHATS